MWFKVDDALHDHHKVRKVDDAAAMGLWVLAGSWSGQNRTDGFVPAGVLRRWSSSWKRLAVKLVDAAMWVEAEQRGEPGYQFVNWASWQPRQEEIDTPVAKLRWSRAKALQRNRALCEAIIERDRGLCRYCGIRPNWKDKRSNRGATYDHIDPDGPNTMGNVVVACRGCNAKKGNRTPPEAGMELLPQPGPYEADAAKSGTDSSSPTVELGTGSDRVQVRAKSDLAAAGQNGTGPAHTNGNGHA